jgi:hypothetical protein
MAEYEQAIKGTQQHIFGNNLEWNGCFIHFGQAINRKNLSNWFNYLYDIDTPQMIEVMMIYDDFFYRDLPPPQYHHHHYYHHHHH